MCEFILFADIVFFGENLPDKFFVRSSEVSSFITLALFTYCITLMLLFLNFSCYRQVAFDVHKAMCLVVVGFFKM